MFYVNTKELFEALDVSSESEILRFFPSRYESLVPTPIEVNPVEGKRYVFRGFGENLKSIPSRSISIVYFTIKMGNFTRLPVVLFNQPFYISKISKGNELLFVCYYSEARKKYIVSSVFDADSYYSVTGIRPVYVLPGGISNSYFGAYIRKIFSYPMPLKPNEGYLPKRLEIKYHLIDEYQALRCIHLPRNQEELKQGLRRFKYEEALVYCLNSQETKERINQIKKKKNAPIDHQKINGFVKSLGLKLTKDQLVSIREIVLDMEKESVMYRLLQGDVGTGKTMVAFVSLYANFIRGRQGIMMAPTFELASQHYTNASKVFSDYGIHIGFLNGNLTPSSKKKMLSDIKKGDIDIVIATHAAASDAVEFDDLGLAVIDEQQRFGVKQRELLLNKGNAADLLMMSATPIPRTLSQIVNSDIDVSTLSQFPHGIRDVETSVVRSTDPLIYDQIRFYLSMGRQVFVVAPKINENDRNSANATGIFKEMCSRFGEDKCQLLHGKIKKDVQVQIYHDFLSGVKPILVSTTIVEVGIDVSSAGLLVVYDANFFGLSSLHQLRGRIGRSGEHSSALLVYDGEDMDSKAKLDFLAKTNDGFEIAGYDLKMRGTGSYSGEKQSGRSELKVCNFVNDYPIFVTARSDAKEILADKENPEYRKILELAREKKENFLI